jgi:hypothetical protein
MWREQQGGDAYASAEIAVEIAALELDVQSLKRALRGESTFDTDTHPSDGTEAAG